MEISIEKDKITKSLNELENEFKNGNIPKNHYEFQKRQLTEKLETLKVAERVMKLQGKKTVETPAESSNDNGNDELFKKYITSPGLKKKNIENKSGISHSTKIATALLILAFVIGIGSGIYLLNIPAEVSSVSLYTNDSAFPPFVLNNTTNTTNTTTNTTKKVVNTTETVSTPVTQPTETTTTNTDNRNTEPTDSEKDNDKNTETGNKTAAGEPNTKRTTHKTYRSIDPNNWNDY